MSIGSDLQLDDFNYELPVELIASYPLSGRSDSKLLYCNGSEWEHSYFKNLTQFLRPDDILVFNNTKVLKARLYAKKPTGARVEILIERVLDDPTHCIAHLKSNKSLALGQEIIIDNTKISCKVIARVDSLFKLAMSFVDSELANCYELMEECGQIPLPPYMKREANVADEERYQSIFAQHQGAIAAPTASLHFDEGLIDRIKALGVQIEFITLHVGSGTFKPVKVDKISEHTMHAEYLEVSQAVADVLNQAKASGRRIIAVGTTVLRALETASSSGKLQKFYGMSDIFIYPGFCFNAVDCLITNFHLPKSTLLMLVAAFSKLEVIKRAYQEAIQHKYRFFSYGDGMFLEKL